MKPGRFWFFHHGWAAAHSAVTIWMDCRVYLVRQPRYVVYSPSEDAYWDNELGWMDEVDRGRADSMIFSQKDRDAFLLPNIGTTDAKWTEYSDPEPYIPLPHPLEDADGNDNRRAQT
jgi:hypothetical protein